MRIISQDGKINLPYEMTALLVSDNYIQAVFAGGIQQSPYVMAMYSTQDKLRMHLIYLIEDLSAWVMRYLDFQRMGKHEDIKIGNRLG